MKRKRNVGGLGPKIRKISLGRGHRDGDVVARLPHGAIQARDAGTRVRGRGDASCVYALLNDQQLIKVFRINLLGCKFDVN